MIYGYIGAALAVGILIGVIALAIKWMSRKVTDSINRRTIGLMSAYDELLEQKSKELSKVKQETIMNRPASVKHQENQKVTAHDGDVSLDYAELMNSSTYLGTDYGSIYKKIRDGFNTKPEDIIALYANQQFEPGPSTRLLETLDYDMVFKLSSISREEQLSLLNDTLDESGKMLLSRFMDKRSDFSIIDFYDFLKQEALLEPQRATLYVSQRDSEKAYPSDVNVMINNDICEGFQLEANNNLYEYSIKESEMV